MSNGRTYRKFASQRGFTLVELAVVILIMGLVLGGLALPVAAQRENQRLRQSTELLDDVQAALEGYLMQNGYLPCPATPGSAGRESGNGNACTVQHGFLPATTLGIDGARNADNLLLDPWGAPLRYSVTDSDVDGDGRWDFVSPGEMRDVGMPSLAPDLVVCSTAAGSSATACGNANSTLVDTAPAIVLSLGKDWADFSSSDQMENVGDNLGGGPSAQSYPVADDIVFVSRTRNRQPGAEFDDPLRWLSANALYHRMVTAGRLP